MNVLWALAAIYAIGQLIVIIAVCCSKKGYSGSNVTIIQQPSEPKDYGQPGISNRDNPTIAEQYDTRITNVFKNPMEGIL